MYLYMHIKMYICCKADKGCFPNPNPSMTGEINGVPPSGWLKKDFLLTVWTFPINDQGPGAG